MNGRLDNAGLGPIPRIALVATCLMGGYTIEASAQEAPGGGQSLEQAANDPTASLMAFQLQDFYSPSVHNADGASNIVQFRAAVPFTVAGYDNIARLTLPFVTENAAGPTGVSDTTIFNLVAFNRPWGRFGVGAVGLVPTGERGIGAGNWAIGPAAGFAARSEILLWGVFNQNLFGVAEQFEGPDLNISTLQPLLNYSLARGWSVGVSEMTFVYDWDSGEFTSLPLGAKASKLVRFGRTPVQFQGSYEHNFYDEGFGAEDAFGLTVKVLLPAG